MTEYKNWEMSQLTDNKIKFDEAREAIAKLTRLFKELKLEQVGECTFDNLYGNVDKDAKKLETELQNRRRNFKKYLAVYTKRTNHVIPSELQSLESQIAVNEAVVAKKRKAMIDAGIDEAETKKLVPDYDKTKEQEQVDELKHEQKQWDVFRRTGQLEDLPKDAEKYRVELGL